MYVLVNGSDTAIVIDPNVNEECKILLKSININKVLILLTHEHYDHISGVNWLKDLFLTEIICTNRCADNIKDPVKNLARFTEVIHPNINSQNEFKVDYDYWCESTEAFQDEKKIVFDNSTLVLKSAPGHAQGACIIFLDNDVVFTGDNLVGNGLGVIQRWPGGSAKDFLSISRPMIENLSDETVIMPGHGDFDRLANLRQYLEFYR